MLLRVRSGSPAPRSSKGESSGESCVSRWFVETLFV